MIQYFRSRWRIPTHTTITKNVKPLLSHFGIQNQNPVNAQIWKNRITLPGNKRSQNASLFFCTCIALTKRNDSLSVCTCCMCTPICPLTQTHTDAHTHTYAFSSFTQNSDMTHCWRGGILPVFWFLWFQRYEHFFLLWGRKRPNNTQNLSNDKVTDSISIPV